MPEKVKGQVRNKNKSEDPSKPEKVIGQRAKEGQTRSEHLREGQKSMKAQRTKHQARNQVWHSKTRPNETGVLFSVTALQ